MNTTTIRRLALTPLAVAAFSVALGVTPAQADPGPSGPGPIGQPTPTPDPHPNGPEGPGEITSAPNDPEPCGTCDDFTSNPGDPGDGDNGGGTGGNGGHGNGGNDGGNAPEQPGTQPQADPHGTGSSVPLPTRIDAGFAGESSDDGLELAWLLAGGSLVVATGAAVTRRRRTA